MGIASKLLGAASTRTRCATVLLVGLGLVSTARADDVVSTVNRVGRVEARGEADRTVVIVHGSAMPSFTAYRLEKPARLVVDLANGKLAPDPSHDGPIDVDTWAVGQIATAQYQTERTKTARVMIGLKRACTYDIKPQGNDLYIIVTASDPQPAGASVANVDAANKHVRDAEKAAAEAMRKKTESESEVAVAQRRKSELEAQASDIQRRKSEGESEVAAAQRRKNELEAQAATAQRKKAESESELVATQKKRSELEARVAADEAHGKDVAKEAAAAEMRRRDVLARLADEEKRLSALKDARAEEERRARKQNDAEKAEADATRRAEAARMEAETAKARALAARAEVERLQVTRVAEENKIAELSRKASQGGERERKELEAIRAEAAREQARLQALKAEAEQRAKRRATELAKIDEAQAEARKAAERRAVVLDEARVIADKKATDAAQARMAEERRAQAQVDEASRKLAAAEANRKLATTEQQRQAAEAAAKRAAADARRDEEKVASLRKEAERIAKEAEVARAQVEAARRESVKLAEVQTRERARLESSRLEAQRLADQRQIEIERANHATAMASGEKTKIEAAEREARRLAELRQKESARLEAARHAAEEAQALRVAEVRKMEDARVSQRATVLAHERELRMLAERRERELRALAEARASEEAKIASTRDALGKAQSELRAVEQQRTKESDVARAEMEKRRSERDSLERKIAEAKADLERAEAKAKDAAQRAEQAQKRAAIAAVEPPVSQKTKELARSGRATAQVRDVRFADDSDSHRIVIDMQGEPDWRTTPSQHGELTLSLTGADLPKRLERTLDTAAYKGPVKSVSTFADPANPGAVKVVVSLDAKQKGGEPKVTKEGDRLVWEFPREARSTSIAPTRVGGYGASIPLQVAAAVPTNLATPVATRRRQMYNGRRIDLDFKDFDIHNILRLLSDVGQVNIITSDDVKGTVTIRMRDVPWDQALDVILKSKQLGMQREGNLIRVAPQAVLEKEMEADIARAKAAIELKPLDTRLIPLSYAAGDKMMPRVQELLSSRGKVSVDERTNMLIVSDVASNIALAEDLVRNLDTQTPQVLIEARIVEARQTFSRTVGIQWGGNTFNGAATGNPTGLTFPSTVGVAGAGTDPTSPTAGLQGAAATNPNYVVNLPAPTGTGSGGGLGIVLGSLAGTYNINLRLSALEATGQVRIVSAPKITTLDNVEASIEQGVAIPISVVSAAGTNTVFVDAKLNLTVKPHVTNERSVVMHVDLTRNEPDFVNVGARGDPTILKKQAKTEMLVRDGDTAVIGGIFTRNSGTSYQKLPWIADVPILGWLFKNRRENDDRTELLIFITPRIVNTQPVAR